MTKEELLLKEIVRLRSENAKLRQANKELATAAISDDEFQQLRADAERYKFILSRVVYENDGAIIRIPICDKIEKFGLTKAIDEARGVLTNTE